MGRLRGVQDLQLGERPQYHDAPPNRPTFSNERLGRVGIRRQT